ncbi:hypothetical protein SteCoe_8254 [Stentor coeruleus]|uniref:RBR-type E3 ubiquitin transferase n=1 Tax=Stentor coeruleus TaxID=5963 RepID=A0A1R2CKK8_9CILI|nr:hypothetical protein SteCoe_8254 [Stentor coeruleus]
MSFSFVSKKATKNQSIEMKSINTDSNKSSKNESHNKNPPNPPKNIPEPIIYITPKNNSVYTDSSPTSIIKNKNNFSSIITSEETKKNIHPTMTSPPAQKLLSISSSSSFSHLNTDKDDSESEREKLEYEILEDQNLISEKKELLKQQVIENLENTINKNSRKCAFCSSPIDPTDTSTVFLCKHISCYICIYNRLQEIISEDLPQLMTCNCKKIVYYYLFKGILESESLDLYVEMISKMSKLDYNLTSFCPYCRHKNTCKNNNTFHSCDKCNNEYCVKCGQSHISKTCFEYYNQEYKHELLAKIPKCTECKDLPLEIELSCECKLCIVCAKKMIIDFLYNISPIDDPKCKLHQLIIPRVYVYSAFGGEYGFIKEQEKAIDYMILTPKFICEICLNENNVNKSITLDCDHRFCHDCVKRYLNALIIDSSTVNNITCPKCEKKIPYDIIKSNSSPEVFDKYLNFTLMAYQPEKNERGDDVEEEVMKWCIKCNYGCLISIKDNRFKCPNCSSECCPKCNKKHYLTICEDLKLSMTQKEIKSLLGYSDNYFDNFMKNYSKCPNCKEAIEKMRGCNFMECKWPRCKEIYFCAICNKRLRKDQHYSHYKRSGPFGGTCNMTDHLPDD